MQSTFEVAPSYQNKVVNKHDQFRIKWVRAMLRLQRDFKKVNIRLVYE